MDTVLGLPREVLRQVVDDDHSLEISSEHGQVFDVERAIARGVLAVQPMLHDLLRVEVVDDPVGVVLHGSGPDHDLIALGH